MPVDLPLPPDELIENVVGHRRRDAFASSRTMGVERIQGYLRDAGFDPDSIRDVLDFGCGCGRLLAGWRIKGVQAEISGCDIDPVAIEWIRENIPGVSCWQSELEPPLPPADASFDLIYSISVFTHLSLDLQRDWAQELRRLARPGAAIFVTFHGHLYYDTFFGQVADGRTILEQEGHLAIREEFQGTRCATLHRPEKLVEVFEGFEPLLHIPGPCHVAGSQDAYVFRKPA